MALQVAGFVGVAAGFTSTVSVCWSLATRAPAELGGGKHAGVDLPAAADDEQ